MNSSNSTESGSAQIPRFMSLGVGAVLLAFGIQSCRVTETKPTWLGLSSETVDKGPDWFAIILLVGIGSAVAFLVARLLMKGWQAVSPDQVPAVEVKPSQMPASPASPQSGDDLIASVTGQEPIALVLTGSIDDFRNNGPWGGIVEGSFRNLPTLARIIIATTMVGTWIWNPFGTDRGYMPRIWVAVVAGCCAGALLRLVVGRTHVPIHDALVFGEDHVWLLVGCRMERQTRAITCSSVDRHRKDQVTASVGQGLSGLVTKGRLVHVVVKAPGDWLKTAKYTLRQDTGHLDRQYFSRNVVTVAEAGAVLR